LLREIVNQHPLEGRALIQLGQLAWKTGDHEFAIMQFQRAAKIDEFENPALIENARLLVYLRKYQQAANLLERALLIKLVQLQILFQMLLKFFIQYLVKTPSTQHVLINQCQII